MICYQDEKLYVSVDRMKSAEELDKEIEELEVEIYGKVLSKDETMTKRPMIYDVQQDKLIRIS